MKGSIFTIFIVNFCAMYVYFSNVGATMIRLRKNMLV